MRLSEGHSSIAVEAGTRGLMQDAATAPDASGAHLDSYHWVTTYLTHPSLDRASARRNGDTLVAHQFARMVTLVTKQVASHLIQTRQAVTTVADKYGMQGRECHLEPASCCLLGGW